MECKGDCPWKEKLRTNARILKQENGLTLDVKLWRIFGPFTSLFAFVGKVGLEQAQHFEVFCLDRRNEEFIDFELERTSEVFNLVSHPVKEFSSMVTVGLQPWLSVPTSQRSCLSWVSSLCLAALVIRNIFSAFGFHLLCSGLSLWAGEMRAPALMTNWAVVQEGSWAGLRVLYSLRNKHGTTFIFSSNSYHGDLWSPSFLFDAEISWGCLLWYLI